MNPDRQFATVAASQVLNCPTRYQDYHVDLVNLLVKVVAAQSDGLSDQKRRSEVLAIVETFSNTVAGKIKE